MQLSEDTVSVLNYLSEYTENNLRKKNDFGIILEICATYGGEDIFNRIIFTGKSLWSIYSKLRKADPSQEGIDLLKKEVERCSSEIRSYLTVILEHADTETKERFSDIYMQMTSGCLKNIIDLSHDLAKFKELQNKAKFKSKET